MTAVIDRAFIRELDHKFDRTNVRKIDQKTDRKTVVLMIQFRKIRLIAAHLMKQAFELERVKFDRLQPEFFNVRFDDCMRPHR